jgi:hypothetical protein
VIESGLEQGWRDPIQVICGRIVRRFGESRDNPNVVFGISIELETPPARGFISVLNYETIIFLVGRWISAMQAVA